MPGRVNKMCFKHIYSTFQSTSVQTHQSLMLIDFNFAKIGNHPERPPPTAFACSTVSRLRVKTHSFSSALNTHFFHCRSYPPLSLLVNKVKQQQQQKTETRYLQEKIMCLTARQRFCQTVRHRICQTARQTFCVRPPGRHSVSGRQAKILCQTARHTFCVRPPGIHFVSDRQADILCQTARHTFRVRPPGRHSVSDHRADIMCQTAGQTFCVRPPGTHSVSDRQAHILCQTAGQTFCVRPPGRHSVSDRRADAVRTGTAGNSLAHRPSNWRRFVETVINQIPLY